MVRAVKGRRTAGSLLGLAALALGALAASCGQDTPATQHDCCVDAIFYVCSSLAAYGKCVSTPPDVSGCTQRSEPCPPDSNQ